MSVDKYQSIERIFRDYGKDGINIDQCMQVFKYIDNYINLDQNIKNKLFPVIQQVGKNIKKQKPLAFYQQIVHDFMVQEIQDEDFYRHGVNVIAILANKFFANIDKLNTEDKEEDDVIVIDEKDNEKGIHVGKKEESKKKKSKVPKSEEKSGSQEKKRGKKPDSKEGGNVTGNLSSSNLTKGKSKEDFIVEEVNEEIEEALHKEVGETDDVILYRKEGTMYVIEDDKPNKTVEELLLEASDEWKRYRNPEIYLYLIDRYLNSIMRNEVIHGIYMLVYFAKIKGADYHFVLKNILRTMKMINIKSILDVFKGVTTNEKILNDTIDFLKTYVELEDHSFKKGRMYSDIFPTERAPKQKQQIQTIDKILLKNGAEYYDLGDGTRYYKGGFKKPFRTVPLTSDEIKNVLVNLKK